MININLIAERRSRKLREMTILRISTLSVIALTAVMVLWNATAFVYERGAQGDLNRVNERIAGQQDRYSTWQKVQEEITARKPLVTLLEQVQKSEGAWMTILGDISQITSKDVVIDNITTTNSDKGVALKVAGRARDESAVSVFMEAFNKSTGWAGKTDLKTLNGLIKNDTAGGDPLKRSLVHFELNVPVRGMVGGDL